MPNIFVVGVFGLAYLQYIAVSFQLPTTWENYIQLLASSSFYSLSEIGWTCLCGNNVFCDRFAFMISQPKEDLSSLSVFENLRLRQLLKI